MERKKLKIYNSFAEIEKEDKEYYRSLSPYERLRITELLREIYYEDTLQRLPRIFQIIRKP